MADKKITIKEPCFVNGKLAKVGASIEVDENDASHMVGNGRAVYFTESAQTEDEKTDGKDDKK